MILSCTYKGYKIFRMGNGRWKATDKTTTIWANSLSEIKRQARSTSK